MTIAAVATDHYLTSVASDCDNDCRISHREILDDIRQERAMHDLLWRVASSEARKAEAAFTRTGNPDDLAVWAYATGQQAKIMADLARLAEDAAKMVAHMAGE